MPMSPRGPFPAVGSAGLTGWSEEPAASSWAAPDARTFGPRPAYPVAWILKNIWNPGKHLRAKGRAGLLWVEVRVRSGRRGRLGPSLQDLCLENARAELASYNWTFIKLPLFI